MNNLTPDVPQFWRGFYQQNTTPWDLGQPAPPFVHLLKESANQLPRGKVAVVGCGRGHDAALFACHGFDVTGMDIAPEAVTEAQRLYGHEAAFEVVNLFNLEEKHKQAFDYVIEHTLFCAILPTQRKAYVNAVYQLLKPRGIFIGLLWAHTKPDGPPYKTTRSEVEELFSPYFDIQHLEITPHSITGRENDRKNQELLAIFQKKH